MAFLGVGDSVRVVAVKASCATVAGRPECKGCDHGREDFLGDSGQNTSCSRIHGTAVEMGSNEEWARRKYLSL